MNGEKLIKYKITRRNILLSLAGIGIAGLSGFRFFKSKIQNKIIPGKIDGASFIRGHRLKDLNFPSPSKTIEKSVVIVGSGISGLTAAYNLKKNNMNDFVLLELENFLGGNSSSRENKISRYPLGAHYVPLLSEESIEAKALFEDLSIITGYSTDGKKTPIYNEYYVCSDPHERLFLHGRWQEGLIPYENLPQKDLEEIERFLSHTNELKSKRGRDGKRVFAIPMEKSSSDEQFKKLDKISFKEYLLDRNYRSEYLFWYVNYCCRDDFGMGLEQVSAWAGLHYFAGRNGKGHLLSSGDVITWPEGNGWIAKKLQESVKDHCQKNKIVFNIEEKGDLALLDYFDFELEKTIRIKSKKIIYSAPRFTALRTLKKWRDKLPSWSQGLDYAPWMVANISLKEKPTDSSSPLSWDNVNFNGRSLGYVVATHQSFKIKRNETVITLYWPLSHLSPRKARIWALGRSHQDWVKDVISELDAMHPDIEEIISNIDICLWGHAMISPKVNSLWGQSRAAMNKQEGPVHFAHSDMSGFSIFEEAHYWGMKASGDVLKELNDG